jgi:hypothetical protein
MRASEFIVEGNDKEFHTGGALGLPFPGSYEQEYDMFKRKGSRRITAMTNEALDSSYDYEGNAIGGRYFFETEDGVEYKVYFSGNNLVEVAFNASTDGGDTWKTTMIGTGNASKVFGTVIKIIQEYVAVQQPKALYFTADKDERGRVSLYKRLASQVDRALPNYVDAGPNDLGSGVAFMVKRKGDKINFSGEDDLINEIADSPYDYIQNVKTPAKRAYRFQTDNGQLYRVQVLNRETPDIKNFGINKNLEIHFDLTDMKTGKPNTGRTNTGDSIRVFSTVANILQKEVAEQKPTGIVIASKADDEGRVRLYKTLARRATKLMPDYVEAGEQTVTGHDGSQYITIQLKRKDLVSEKWSKKYKSSINCNNPKGFSQRAHCQGRKK